jgi:hypothetical protein
MKKRILSSRILEVNTPALTLAETAAHAGGGVMAMQFARPTSGYGIAPINNIWGWCYIKESYSNLH